MRLLAHPLARVNAMMCGAPTAGCANLYRLALTGLVLAALSFIFAWGIAHAEVAVPPFKARVIDLTGTLSVPQQAKLEQELQAFEARKGSQIAVLMVPTTQPEAIEQYSLRVAEAWKLGRKGVDDGALLVIAKDDRALRIETGYGLEGVMPDIIAKRVIAETITPYFKQADYYGGIQAGINRMIRLVDGEPLPPPRKKDMGWSGLQDFLPVAFIGIFVIGGVLRSIFGRFVGASIAGGVTGFIAWFLIGSLIGAGVVGVVAFLSTLSGIGGIGRGGVGGGGGFGGGGGGFGGGGGGGFGGGGASGRW